MENFEYEYHSNQPPKSGFGRALIITLIVIILLAAAFFVGVLSRDYFNLLPEKSAETADATDTSADSTPEADATPIPETTPVPTQEAASSVSAYNDIPTVVEHVMKGVVSITTYYSSTSNNIDDWEPMAYGTGIIISSDGYIVTNNHVIADSGRVSVTLYDGEKVEAQIIGSDQYVDLAVIKIEKDGLYTIPFGDSSQIRPGEQVIAIGSPLGDELTGTVTAGIISAVDRQIEVDGIPFTLLQTDAAVNPGNSGGPLVNMNGEVIGVTSLKSIFAGYDEYGTAIAAEGISYAIPSNSVQDSINDILEYGGIVRPFIGVNGYDNPEGDGFLIALVVENGPAQAAGILAEDIILAVDGEPIAGFSDLFTEINAREIGDTMTLTIYRTSTDEELEFEVTLASNQDFN